MTAMRRYVAGYDTHGWARLFSSLFTPAQRTRVHPSERTLRFLSHDRTHR
jgi:hypothetical protein